jgi:hypothetical protein
MCRRNLRFVGLWPNMNNRKYENFISICLFLLSITTIIIFVNVAQTTKLIMDWGDLTKMSDNISTANLPIAVAVIKMLVCISHKKGICKILTNFTLN